MPLITLDLLRRERKTRAAPPLAAGGRWPHCPGLVSAGTIDTDYAITVTLDEGSGTYEFTERKTESESDVRISGGRIEFGGSKQVFTGKSVGKQWGGGAALRATSHGQSGHTWSYEFETSRIKQPLFDLLRSAGWEPEKKGFFARLFSR